MSNALTKISPWVLLIQLLTHSLWANAAIDGVVICRTVGSVSPQYLKPPVVVSEGNVCFFNTGKNATSEQWTLQSLAMWLLGMRGSGGEVPLNFSSKMAGLPEPEGGTANHGNILRYVMRNELMSSLSENSWQKKMFDQTWNHWRSLGHRPPAPTISILVHNYSVRFAVDPGLPTEVRRRIKSRVIVAFLHEVLSHLKTLELVSFFDEWANETSACSSGSDDSNNNEGGGCSYSVPLFSMQEEVVNPMPESISLLEQSAEAAESLLAMLEKKLQQAIAQGNRNLALVLRDRIMLIELDLFTMEDLKEEKLTSLIAAWLRERLYNNRKEVEEKKKQSLQERLELHPQTVNLDPASLIIEYNPLSTQQTAAYAFWLDTPEGIAYTAYKIKLKQYLQDFEESGDGYDFAMPSLLNALEILVQRFWQRWAPVQGIIQTGNGSGDEQGASSDDGSDSEDEPRPKDSSEPGTTSKPTNDKKGNDGKGSSIKHTHTNLCPHRDCKKWSLYRVTANKWG